MKFKILKSKDKTPAQAIGDAEKRRADRRKAGKQKAAKWVADLRYGQTVSLTFFRRNAWILMIFLVVVIALMGLRYQVKTKMEQIKKLEKELVQAESDKLQEKSAYMSLIRETEMKRLVDEKGLGLDFREQPPYEVTLIAE